MVVVEMTSENPSYRYSEGGIFSFIMDNNIIFDKPFKTYEELIAIMEERHINVPDKEFATQVLQNYSYYGIINGYKNTFLQVPNSDSFIPGTNFNELYTLHIIDTGLNNIIFKYILFLEKALKSRISYLVAEKYGVYTNPSDLRCSEENDYLYKKNYSTSSGKRTNVLRSLKERISKDTKSPIMQHYLNDKNHVPPWILTTSIPYGLTIEWYNILISDDKQNICDSFITPGLLSSEQSKEFVRKALELTKEYRNKIAHGNRTFSMISLPQLPKAQTLALTFNAISEEEYNNRMGQNDTFAVLLALIIMLSDKYLVSNLRSELSNTLLPYANVLFNKQNILDIFGFPSDLFQRLDKLITQKFD